MSRIKRGTVTKRRHKRWIKQAKGYWGQRSNVFRRVKETLLRAWAFAYRGRKLRKREFRALFITRIGAATRQHGLAYAPFMNGLKKSDIKMNRKMLSQLAIFEPAAFERFVQIAKEKTT